LERNQKARGRIDSEIKAALDILPDVAERDTMETIEAFSSRDTTGNEKHDEDDHDGDYDNEEEYYDNDNNHDAGEDDDDDYDEE